MMADLRPEDLIVLDETATPTTLTPSRARAPRGVRAVGRVPRRRREQISWLATLTPSGIGASLLVRGAVDRSVFDAFILDHLVPTLRPGQVVVANNLAVHQSARARAAIEAAGGRVLFLPTYSPDYNPIEQAFAKCRQALRHLGPRSFTAVVEAVGTALASITAADAVAFYHAARYGE